MLRPTTPEEAQAAWAAVEEEWAKTVARAQAPEAKLSESVNGEFSFLETLRHLVFAMDNWFTAPIRGEAFHPIGLPSRGSLEFPRPAPPPRPSALPVRADAASSPPPSAARSTPSTSSRS